MLETPVFTNLSAHLTVFGEPASKSNSPRLIRRGKGIRIIKSKKAMNYSDEFKKQFADVAHPLLEGDLLVRMKIYYANRRSDLDEGLILDLMQGLIYKNDRQVKEKHIKWGLDRMNPRAVVEVHKMVVQE